MRFKINDVQVRNDFMNDVIWYFNFESMRCSAHNQSASWTLEENNFFVDVCCEPFLKTILEKERDLIAVRNGTDAISQFHEHRAKNSSSGETILVGGVEVPEVEIKDLWYSSKDGDYLELTGNRTMPVPKNEVQKVRDFLERRNYNLGIRRQLHIGGQEVFDDEILEVVYQDKTPFVKLTDGRLIELKPVEVDVVEHFVTRNKKLRGEL